MIILNRKKIKLILTSIFILLFVFAIQITNNNNLKKQNSIETTSTPSSGKVVILDAGHGSPDERCQKQ